MKKLDVKLPEYLCASYEGDDLFTSAQLIEFGERLLKAERNRLADELQKMPLNDTANSIAIWIREQE